MSIDHRTEAARLVDGVLNDPEMPVLKDGEGVLTAALVHATLARNEEQATETAELREALQSRRRRLDDMRELVAHHIAAGLASREKDRWQAAIDLTKALDEADCNMDALIDARLSDDGWDPRAAYKTPAGGGGWIAAANEDTYRDPWGPAPDVTADIPERVHRVLTERLAEMLLDPESAATEAARQLTFALKHAGADLTPEIEKRITSLTLGRDPAEPPF